MGKRKRVEKVKTAKRQKQEADLVVEESAVDETNAVTSTEVPLRPTWSNRERVLVFCSRGASHRDRHLMLDFRSLLPHSRAESKLDKKQDMKTIVELAELKKCTKVLYFENRKRKDLYMWLAATSPVHGPTCRFLVRNVHTMAELRMTGNCLRGSRPVLSFDAAFTQNAHMQLLKELFTQTFATPQYYPTSKPFIDRVMTFSVTADERIWIRNFQICNENNAQLEEVGPRLVLEIIKIFDGAFSGAVLYENSRYISPNLQRRQQRLANVDKYNQRVQLKEQRKKQRSTMGASVSVDKYDSVFDTDNAQEKLKAALR